jgi:hypothetical protein
VGVVGDFSFFAVFGTGVRGLLEVLRVKGTSIGSSFTSGSAFMGSCAEMGDAEMKEGETRYVFGVDDSNGWLERTFGL